MIIDQLTPGAEVRLRAIRLEALGDAPDAFGTTLDEALALELSAWRTQLEQLPTFVASLEGVDVGMVRGVPDKDREGVAYLISMWVSPKARGQRIGGVLIDRVIEWARAAGFSTLVLDVADDNASAIALYERKGFKATGRTGSLPSPRQHVAEHERALDLT